MSDARTKKNHGHFYLYDYSRAMLASILVPLFLRRKTVLPAGCSNNKPTTSVKERSSTNFIRRALSFLSLFSLFPPLDISPTYPGRKMEAKWPRGVRSADCQRDNVPRCCTAKVLSVRVYIGRSRKRWISTVSRPRAKLLRDVFVVSFAGVCGLWRNHGPVRR